MSGEGLSTETQGGVGAHRPMQVKKSLAYSSSEGERREVYSAWCR